jgi:transposase InsO family protein
MRRPARLRVASRWKSATAILDNGSDINIVSKRLVGDTPLLPIGDLASTSAYGEYGQLYGHTVRVLQLTDDWGVSKKMYLSFVVADISDDILLGRPWEDDIDPVINTKRDIFHYRIAPESLQIAASTRQARRWANEAKIRMVLTTGREQCTLHTVMKQDTTAVPSGDEAPKTLPPEYQQYASVFSEEEAAKLAPLEGPSHPIELEPGATPFWGPIYSLAEKELVVLHEYIQMALQRGWIRRSTSSYGAPVLFVPKKGGKLRLCVDYRALNRVTRKDRTPLPLIHEIMDRLKGAVVYTKFDLKDAYHRIRIREGDEPKTAFRCKYGLYEYQVMPFGLTNAPATFQTHINTVLGDLIDSICIVYLDDILIYSSDPAEHTRHVSMVLERLQKHGLYANLQKCEFRTTTVSYLGFVISPEGIHMEKDRIEAVASWPEPRSVNDILSFLGFTNFYRRFIKNYSKITVPLTDLTKGRKTGPLKLSTRGKAAFNELKQKFLEEPILAHFDPDAPIRVETDASNYAIGAILSQMQRESWHPVAYLSRKLGESERHYQTPDAEMLAITEAFRVWRHYLAYAKEEIQVITDHLNHSFLATKKKLTSKQVSQLQELAPYNFRIEYRPGKANPADGLSRRPDLYEKPSKEELTRSYLLPFMDRFHDKEVFPDVDLRNQERTLTPGSTQLGSCLDSGSRPEPVLLARRVASAVNQMACLQHASGKNISAWEQIVRRSTAATSQENSQTLVDALLKAQKGDARTDELIQKRVRGDSSTDGLREHRWIVSRDQLLRYRSRVWVPHSMRTELILLFHDDLTAGHQGVSRTLARIAKNYFWEGMKRDIKKHINTCIVCQTSKPRHHRPYGLLAALPVPQRPWQEISMDFITGLPEITCEKRTYDSILVVVDRFTKYALYIPCSKHITSDGLANKFLRYVFKPYGIPEGIVSDRGTIFTSAFWRTFCYLLSCKRRLSTAFHPQTDGQTERQNQNLEHYLRAFCNKDQLDWLYKLPLAEFTYNTAKHSASGYSPAHLLLSYDPVMPGNDKIEISHMNESAIQRIQRMHETRKQAAITLQESSDAYHKWYNNKRQKKHFNVGDWVLISTKHLQLRRPSRKLAEKYAGPYQIESIVGNSNIAYKLRLPTSVRIHPVFNVTNLEEYKSRDNAPEEPIDNPFMAEETYEVEKILDHKKKGRGRIYYVKWKGWSDEHNTWQKRSDFVQKDIINEYDASL